MKHELWIGLRYMALLTVLTGLVYPVVVTGLCQALFRRQANGSLVEHQGQVIGSELIGQDFARAEYFHPRPSAAGKGYDPTQSGGSNLGPTNAALRDRMTAAVAAFHKDNPDFQGAIPADLLTTSGSGLDPEESPAAALAQVARVAAARHADAGQIRALVESSIEQPQWGLLGEARVNVLDLNLKLDERVPYERH